jgi:hypothetical protein
MDVTDLEKAAALNEQLKRSRRDQEALSGYKVVGVIIDTGEGSLRPFTINRNSGGGTGPISSLCWSEELQAGLTEAFHEVYSRREKAALEMLKKYGIDIAI